ncbi:MAG: hypothetical protein LBV58_00845 [Acholeplasmatales bacterium]|jgi:hypothetical protein|nr:hypothetical protein [Acholeplasmatales bacterium]
MKKILILIAALFICFKLTESNFSAATNITGSNILNLENLKARTSTVPNEMVFYTDKGINVKTNTTYTLVAKRSFFGITQIPITTNSFSVYIEKGHLNEYYFTEKELSGYTCYYSEIFCYGNKLDLDDIITSKVTDFSIILFEGTIDNFSGFSHYTEYPNKVIYKNISYSISNTPNLETITSSIEVKDNKGNNLEFIVQSDNYSSNKNSVGIYEVILSASTSNVTHRYVLTIRVLDDVSPEITSSYGNVIKTSMNNPITTQDILDSITITDNIDTLTLQDIFIEKNTYEGHTEVGTYEIILRVRDTSGNVGSITIQVEVVDDVPPVITGPKYIILYTNGKRITREELLTYYSATDNYSTSRVEISQFQYPGENIVGQYFFQVVAYDDARNYTLLDGLIHVLDNNYPIFNDSNLFMSTSSKKYLTDFDLIDSFKKQMKDQARTVNDIEISYNDYKGNEDKIGKYYVYFIYTENQGTYESKMVIEVTRELNSNTIYIIAGVILFTASLTLVIIFRKKIFKIIKHSHKIIKPQIKV